jgi:hypothetical protein
MKCSLREDRRPGLGTGNPLTNGLQPILSDSA